jgi:hypothetical protein
MVDLFGRPIYDGGPVRQPALFDARHWFGLGYADAQRDPDRDPATFPADEAYRHGFEAGRRDLQAGAYSRPEGEQRAWDRNRVVGNVE